jgi:hypothetical protein
VTFARRAFRAAGVFVPLVICSGLAVVLGGVGTATAAHSATRRSQASFVYYLAKQPLALPSGFSFAGAAGYTRPRRPCRCETIPLNAVGLVQIGTKGTDPWGLIQYTVFASSADARNVMVGPDIDKPTFSIWRLKQLNTQSLPDARIAARHINGYNLGVIVEARAHRHAPASWHDTGLTAVNTLVGNVIVNVTTPSRSTNQHHGDRVSALRLLHAAVVHLKRAQHSFVSG